MSESVNITYVGAEGEPDTNVWKGYSFRKGEPVAVSDPHIIEKAKGNRFFEVDGYVKRPQEADGHDGGDIGDIGDLDKMGVRKLRGLAAERGIDPLREDGDGKSKAELIAELRG